MMSNDAESFIGCTENQLSMFKMMHDRPIIAIFVDILPGVVATLIIVRFERFTALLEC